MAKLGSKANPAVVHVQTMERATELLALCTKNNWQLTVGIEPDEPEDISDVRKLLSSPKPIVVSVSTPKNAPCTCGSGKKYKYCCGK